MLSQGKDLGPPGVAQSGRGAVARATGEAGAKITYRGWHIRFDPPPIPTRNCDWQFWHDDYDGAPNYGDEGPADNRCGSAPSLEAAKAEIDLWHEEKSL